MEAIGSIMLELLLNRAFTLIEPGPVTLVSTHDSRRDNGDEVLRVR